MAPNASSGRVSAWAWLPFALAVLMDAFKVVLFIANATVVLVPLVFVASFFVSVIEIFAVFGWLWALGLYKPGKNQFFNTMATFGVSVMDLIPEWDDIPFTSPTVFFMITSAYARQKAEEAVTPAPRPIPAPPQPLPPPANEGEPEEAAAQAA